ncbi:MAG: tetratricopeptide repeat protein [Spirochaetota bacterium]
MKLSTLTLFRTIVVLLAVITFAALMDYPHVVSTTVKEYDLDNPMYDVFYLYYDDQRREALSILEKAMNKKEYRESAFINRGLIAHYEGSKSSAINWYQKSLSSGIRGTTYILHYTANTDPGTYNSVLSRLEKIDNSYWIDYERAAVYAKKGDSAVALHHLEKAFRKGFHQFALISHDPAWRRLRNSNAYKKLKDPYKAKGVTVGETNALINTTLALARSKTFGLSPELAIAHEMLITGTASKSLPYLQKVIATSSNSRHVFIARYWRARLFAKSGKKNAAKIEISKCRTILKEAKSNSSLSELIPLTLFQDIIENDPVLKKL